MKKLLFLINCLIFIMGLSGCGAVFEDLEPCNTKHYLRLTHKMNMKFADAFASEVKGVTLFVYDNNDELVSTFEDLAPQWMPGGYVIELPQLPEGDYQFIAWCGDSGNGSFFQPVRSEFTKEELSKYLNLNSVSDSETEYMDEDLDRLFHGSSKATIARLPAGETRFIDMDLTKDTNTIRVMLQNVDGTILNKEDFTFEITDRNSRLDYENLPEVNTPENLYRPFAVTELRADMDPNSRAISEITSPTGLLAEISTSRLMAYNEPILRVKRKNGETVLAINLVSYFDAIKGEGIAPMGLQEYLDRQDSYNLTLFLRGDEWVKSMGIYINSWKVVPEQRPDF